MHLDLLHPYMSQKVIDKQERLASVTKQCWKFAVGDWLYARNFRVPSKWIPVTVTHILGPVSYQVQTFSGSTQLCCVNQLRYRHSLASNSQEPNDFDDLDDGPFLCTTSTTKATPHLEQGQGQLEVTSFTTTSLRRSNRNKKAVDHYGPYLSI